MPEPEAAAKSCGTGSDATSSPRGTVIDMGSLCTESRAPTADQTMRRIASGDAEAATDATPNAITPGRSSLLSAVEEQNLDRIRSERRKGYMVSLWDVDFLLEILGRVEG